MNEVLVIIEVAIVTTCDNEDGGWISEYYKMCAIGM